MTTDEDPLASPAEETHRDVALPETAPLPAILLSIAYDGRRFAGFARQPTQRTIAGELLGAVQAIDPTVRDVRGVSRTDAGVHARDQRVAFDPKLRIPPRGWALGLARHLPEDIAIRRAALVPSGFVPRFTSVKKRYRYRIAFDQLRDPFLEGRAWRIPERLDDATIARLREEAAPLLGTHDFAAFRSSADEREDTVRTLYAVTPERDPADPNGLWITVEGTAFMHNMVRILVGTLIDVVRGRKPPGSAARALVSRSRRDAGITAPPDGLVLDRVWLENEGTEAWPDV
ncbi:MAG: tRNA pseudouridine(38-40) synthase TruA [Polyangiaceae bacterium]